MRRLATALGALVAALAVAALVVLPMTADDEPSVPAAESRFAAVRLAAAVVPPEPMFTRAIYAKTSLKGVAVMLDACHGPIAVPLGPTRPVLVAEHDYCGGSKWMPKLAMGDAVRLSGDGVEPGLYVVDEIRFQIRREAKVRDLPDADVVLQTCVTKTKLVLVGLKRFEASTA